MREQNGMHRRGAGCNSECEQLVEREQLIECDRLMERGRNARAKARAATRDRGGAMRYRGLENPVVLTLNNAKVVSGSYFQVSSAPQIPPPPSAGGKQARSVTTKNGGQRRAGGALQGFFKNAAALNLEICF